MMKYSMYSEGRRGLARLGLVAVCAAGAAGLAAAVIAQDRPRTTQPEKPGLQVKQPPDGKPTEKRVDLSGDEREAFLEPVQSLTRLKPVLEDAVEVKVPPPVVKWEYAILRWDRDGAHASDNYRFYSDDMAVTGETSEAFFTSLGIPVSASHVEMLNYFGARRWEVCARDTHVTYPVTGESGLTSATKRTVVIYLKRTLE